MNLEIYTLTGWQPISQRQSYITDYEYDGTQTVTFDIATGSEMMQYIKNDVMIRNEENQYLIKQINHRANMCSITCDLDMDDWKTMRPFVDTSTSPYFINKQLQEVLSYIKPKHWNIINAQISEVSGTLACNDACAYDVLMECQKVYGIVFKIDTNRKVITVLDPNQSIDKGLYITPELNRTDLTYVGDSSTRVTRLSAYGKKAEDGTYVNFASINDGLDYVEDLLYDNKVIWATWRDDSYTDPKLLLADAQKKLKEMAYPQMSFTVGVNDLAQYDEEYAFLDFALYDVVHTIIDKHTSIQQSIIKLRHYHDTPQKNEITLSTKASKITSKIDKTIAIIGEDGQKLNNTIAQTSQASASKAIQSWAQQGHIYQDENDLYVIDQLPKEAAKNCICINKSGISFSSTGFKGPYLKAWGINGTLNADFIHEGELKGVTLSENSILNANISTDEDMQIGNNLFIGKQDDFEYQKGLYFSDSVNINANNEEAGSFLNLQSSDAISIHCGSDNEVNSPSSKIICNKNFISIHTSDEMQLHGKSIILSKEPLLHMETQDIENIQTIDVSSLIDEMDIKCFNYLDGSKQHLGILPQMYFDSPHKSFILHEENDGAFAINYHAICMALIQKVQHLQSDLNKLKEGAL